MRYSSERKRLFTRQFWKTIEHKYYVLFILGVFFTFTTIGFSVDIFNQFEYSYKTLFILVLSTGLISAAYTFAATKNWWLFLAAVPLQIIYIVFLRSKETIEMTDAVLQEKTIVVSLGILVSMMLGYIFFVLFITKVGIKHFLMKAEMDIAKDIHDVLVPDIQFRYERFDIFGRSIPTSEVGGDLIDLIKKDSDLICAISDVSGHGVSSGVYTGMFKSAMRTILQSNKDVKTILKDINSAMQPIMKKSMFITSAIIKISDNGKAEFSVAGHLPILHFKNNEKSFKELMIKQIPVGFKKEFEFKSKQIEYEKGDIFVLITDGITETTNRKKEEFGLERIKDLVSTNSVETAEGITGKILNEVKKFGDQKDDVTLMIIKC